MHARIAVFVVIAVAVVLAVSACGGGSKKVTKGDFVARADAVCATTQAQVRSLPTGSGSLAGTAKYFRSSAALLHTQAVQLRAIPRPKQAAANAKVLEQFLTATSQSAAIYRRIATAAANGDQGALTSAEAALGANPAPRLAARYGLRVCGTSSVTASGPNSDQHYRQAVKRAPKGAPLNRYGVPETTTSSSS